MATASPDLQALAARLELLEAERDILRTLYRYGHSIDYGLEREWVDCFTEDGEITVKRRHGTGRPGAKGRAELATFIAGHTRAPGRWHKHLLIEPRIAIDGDTATAVSYMSRLDEHKGIPVVWVFGRYLDRLVKCADGVWRLKERIVEMEGIHPDRVAQS